MSTDSVNMPADGDHAGSFRQDADHGSDSALNTTLTDAKFLDSDNPSSDEDDYVLPPSHFNYNAAENTFCRPSDKGLYDYESDSEDDAEMGYHKLVYLGMKIRNGMIADEVVWDQEPMLASSESEKENKVEKGKAKQKERSSSTETAITENEKEYMVEKGKAKRKQRTSSTNTVMVENAEENMAEENDANEKECTSGNDTATAENESDFSSAGISSLATILRSTLVHDEGKRATLSSPDDTEDTQTTMTGTSAHATPLLGPQVMPGFVSARRAAEGRMPAPPPSPPEDVFRQTLSTPTLPGFHPISDPALVEQYRIVRAEDPDSFDAYTLMIKRGLIEAKVKRGGIRRLLHNEYTVELASREDAMKSERIAAAAETRGRSNTLSGVTDYDRLAERLAVHASGYMRGKGGKKTRTSGSASVKQSETLEHGEQGGKRVIKTTIEITEVIEGPKATRPGGGWVLIKADEM